MVDGHVPGEGGYVLALDLRIVKIIKVVKDGDVMTVAEEFFDKVRADESSAAGDENSHSTSVKMKPSPSKGRTIFPITLLVFAMFVLSFAATLAPRLWPELTRPKYVDPAFRLPSSLELASLPTAVCFDFPLGSENGAMTYNAQPFTKNHHLGDDLNGIGGEDSDLGDPIYAVADGRVLLARDGGPGWGRLSFFCMPTSKMEPAAAERHRQSLQGLASWEANQSMANINMCSRITHMWSQGWCMWAKMFGAGSKSQR